MGCFSGHLMSSASNQKLFCEICSTFNCSFDEFVGEKVDSPSYSTAILAPPQKTDFLWSCGHCWVVQICWHIECNTFTASSFRIWNTSTWILSLPLTLFIVMLPKAHLTSDSRCLALGKWSHHHDYLGREDLFCIFLNIYPLVFGFTSHLGHHRVLRRVPCAIHSKFSLVIYFILSRKNVYITPISQFKLPLFQLLKNTPQIQVYWLYILQIYS